jgi:hypothetical protein
VKASHTICLCGKKENKELNQGFKLCPRQVRVFNVEEFYGVIGLVVIE